MWTLALLTTLTRREGVDPSTADNSIQERGGGVDPSAANNPNKKWDPKALLTTLTRRGTLKHC